MNETPSVDHVLDAIDHALSWDGETDAMSVVYNRPAVDPTAQVAVVGDNVFQALAATSEQARAVFMVAAERIRELGTPLAHISLPFEIVEISDHLIRSLRPVTPLPIPRTGRYEVPAEPSTQAPTVRERALAVRRSRNTGPAINPFGHRGL